MSGIRRYYQDHIEEMKLVCKNQAKILHGLSHNMEGGQIQFIWDLIITTLFS